MNIYLITTSYINNKIQTNEITCSFQRDQGVERRVINIYPNVNYQTFDGFGGAITEAAGYVFSKMGKDSQREILESYFGNDGNQYSLVRSHIDSCDFSLGEYSAITDLQDLEMKSFNLDRDEKYIIPLLLAAQKTKGKPLSIVLSPWSPPAFAKTNGNRKYGGKLKAEYREFWANYICCYIKEYRKKGLNVDMITIQNEPNAVQTWDSCNFTSEEEKEFLRDYLHPALVQNGLADVKVNIWDHNKERMFERANAIIDGDTNSMIDGIAFHWYTGSHFEAVELVREAYPDKKLIFTEGCVEYSRLSNKGQLENAQMYAHDIIGNINAGMNAFIDWNIILDQKGGPNHARNYCDAPIMCDIDRDIVNKKLSFTYIGHFSKYIKPGAKRIAFTKYTDKLDITTMKNPDGSIVVVLLNRLEEDIPVALRLEGQVTEFFVPANSIMTGTI